jgi:ABC-type nitrate/sulfonate/bicarbonate transport system ATPase subunit
LHDRPAGAAAVARKEDADLAAKDAVRFRRVVIAFALPGGGSYPAVAATDLAIGAHEFVAIVGPTGCGKSTLLDVAAGLLAPSSGRFRCSGPSSPASIGRRAISSSRTQ